MGPFDTPKWNITLLEVDLHVIFRITPRSKLNPKYFSKITFSKEMLQRLIAIAKVTFVVVFYLMSKESTFCVQNVVVDLKLKNGHFDVKSWLRREFINM